MQNYTKLLFYCGCEKYTIPRFLHLGRSSRNPFLKSQLNTENAPKPRFVTLGACWLHVGDAAVLTFVRKILSFAADQQHLIGLGWFVRLANSQFHCGLSPVPFRITLSLGFKHWFSIESCSHSGLSSVPCRIAFSRRFKPSSL